MPAESFNKPRIGFGIHKLPLKPGATREERLDRSRQMLARVLNLHTTVAFVGSGCSAPLGYPTWKEFTHSVVEHTLASTAHTPPSVIEQLERFKRQLSADAQIGSDRFLFMLGVCQQVFAENVPDGMSEYRKFVAMQFQPRTPPAGVCNPYHALMDLPIDRFVTSNYDCELEKALALKREIPEEELKLHKVRSCPPEKLRTFTQQPQYFEHLALFVLARVEAAKNRIFHCHGSYLDPSSMVIKALPEKSLRAERNLPQRRKALPRFIEVS